MMGASVHEMNPGQQMKTIGTGCRLWHSHREDVAVTRVTSSIAPHRRGITHSIPRDQIEPAKDRRSNHKFAISPQNLNGIHQER